MSVLEAFNKESETICHLQNAKRLLYWDQQVVMARTDRAAKVRGRQQAALALLAHERLTSNAFGDLLERTAEALDGSSESVEAQALQCWSHERKRATSVKPDLVERLNLLGSEAFEAWRKAREASDFSIFEPYLTKMYALKREEAEQIGYEGHPYDAMLDEFEPGMSTETVRGLFAEMRPHLVEGVSLIAGSPVVEEIADGPLDQIFPVEGQKTLARVLAGALGYPASNRIDEGAHPFCSASSSPDVRLVTRYNENEIATAIFATLHEAGHALYEYYSGPELEYTPMRGGASLGVHESQSRLWENLVGRSAPFWRWAFPVVRDIFPAQLGGYSWEDLYRAANRVRPSLIRVEADEVTYSLHVILRFELELGLLAGEIEARDIPALWNEKMNEFLGVDVPNDAQGCLQDIHWSDGLIGYFPTYSLGNLIASDLFTGIERDLPNLDADFERGEFEPLRSWLVDKIYRVGGRYRPKELINRVLGHEIRTGPFLDYLKKKYSALYGVEWR